MNSDRARPRRLVGLIALGLVPVLILTSPQVAEAATSPYTTPVATTISGGSDIGGLDFISCGLSGYWDTEPIQGPGATGFGALVYYNWNCKEGSLDTAGTVNLTLTGPGCPTMTSTFHPFAVNARSDSGTGSPFVPGTDPVAQCAPSQVCWTATLGVHFPLPDDSFSGCQQWALGVPNLGDSSGGLPVCPFMSVKKPDDTGVVNGHDQIVYKVTPKEAIAYNVIPYSVWSISGITYGFPDGFEGYVPDPLNKAVSGGPNGGQWQPSALTVVGTEVARTNSIQTYNFAGGGGGPTTRFGTLIGYGYTVGGAGPIDPWSSSTSEPSSPSLVGLSIATGTYCGFYWGSTIRTTGGPSATPIGPADGSTGGPPPPPPAPPPVPSDTGCGFSLTDPSTWAGAGICALVGLFRQMIGLLQTVANWLSNIASTLTGLAASIGSAIVNALQSLITSLGSLLQSLFVPSPGFYDGKVQSVKHAWDNTAPWTIFAAVGTVGSALSIPDPGGSCTGPPLSFVNPLGHSSVTVHPFSACSGGSATLATITRAGLSVGVWVAAVLLAFRVLAASVGVAVAFGKSGDE